VIFSEFYTYCDVIVRNERFMVLKNSADMWCRISWWIRKWNQISDCFFRSLRNSFWTACCFHDFWPLLAKIDPLTPKQFK